MQEKNYEEYAVSHGWKALATKLVRIGNNQDIDKNGRFINAPISRGSTVIYPSVSAMRNSGAENLYTHKTIYGAMGSPNQHLLEQVMASIEGGTHTQVVSSGLAACTVPLLTYLSAGDHCLLMDSVYGPTRRFADRVLRRFGVEVSYYAPELSPQEVEKLFQPNTRVLFVESPGSHTFELQDIKALSSIAHRHQSRMIIDNTWGIGIFQPFQHGVDISIQALTKYANGHSDLVLGAITVNNDKDWQLLRETTVILGEVGGPEEAWLTLRGLRTLGARLEKQSVSALKIAKWIANQPEVERVLHPALPSCYGHEFWKRDFTGASSLFGVVFKKPITPDHVITFIDSLSNFGIGASWGGYESLVMLTDGEIKRTYKSHVLTGAACRFQIGLEDPEDLIKDLEKGFGILRNSL